MSKVLASRVPATSLLKEDRFKMGGQMYRIVDVEPNDHDSIDIVIWFTPWAGISTRDLARLAVPKATMFKVYYNQQ